MDLLLPLIQDYGYLFVFVATLLEGETVLALAGFAAFQGFLDIKTVILVAFLGGMLGDQIFFYFGRWRGKGFIESRPKLQARAKKVQRLIEYHQNWLIFGSRFMYGFRTIIPIAFGTSRVSGIRFLILNVLGAGVWSVIFGSSGYILGELIEKYIGDFHKAQKFLIIVVVLGVIIVYGVKVMYRRIEQRVIKDADVLNEETLDNPEDKSG